MNPDRHANSSLTRIRKKRCAIYTRKSSEEGLEQDFNSLDAQREACSAYILSQAGEGWTGLANPYDDGGFSGGTMDRPGLKALLADIMTGKINVVVVYKVDRLTRALTDFSRLVEVFDEHQVSFVSVTQAFNTTTSMGRLTLNVLLSFAQFEREVTAERIRDKIAASKKKGLWMGGVTPLGYDSPDKKLVINEAEAKTVRRLFALYQKHKNVRLVKLEADQLGLRTKPRRPNNGRPSGNLPFTRGHLTTLLANPIYAGMISYKGQRYDGQHAAIIDRKTWEEAQVQLAAHSVDRRTPTNTRSPHIFRGCIFDETGDILRPHHANKKGRRYHYYVSSRLLTTPGNPDPAGWRIPARDAEQTIKQIIATWLENERQLETILLPSNARIAERRGLTAAAMNLVDELKQVGPATTPLDLLVARVDLAPDQIRIGLDPDHLRQMLKLPPMESSEPDDIVIVTPIELRRRGIEARLVTGDGISTAAPDTRLIAAIAAAKHWFADIESGKVASVRKLATRDKVDPSHISRTLLLAFLAPDIVTAIMEGRIDPRFTLSRIKRLKLPASWTVQRVLFGLQ